MSTNTNETFYMIFAKSWVMCAVNKQTEYTRLFFRICLRAVNPSL